MTHGLTTTVLVVVLFAGVLHAIWNAITKALSDRIAVFAVIGVALTVCGAAVLAANGMPPEDILGFVLASAAVHIGYDLALVRSYRLGAFNQMYPVARGTAPLLVALGAFVVAGEGISTGALAGIAVLAGGLMTLALTSRLERAELPAIGAALLTGVTIAAYTLIDGLGSRQSHDPVSYAALLFVVQGPMFVGIASVRDRGLGWARSEVMRPGLIAGVLTALAYGAVIWAQARAPLAEVSALRETGVISAALIGAFFFKEGFGPRRVVAALLVALGILLIGV